MRQQRIEFDIGDGVFARGTLLDHAHAVNYDSWAPLTQQILKPWPIEGIHLPDHVAAMEKIDVVQPGVIRGGPNRAPGVRGSLLENLENLVAEHARATKDQNIHLYMPMCGAILTCN